MRTRPLLQTKLMVQMLVGRGNQNANDHNQRQSEPNRHADTEIHNASSFSA